MYNIINVFGKFSNKNLNISYRRIGIIQVLKKYFSTSKNNEEIVINKENVKKIKFKFVYKFDKKVVDVEAEEGQSILEVAHKYDVDLEGACDSSLACSTCHVILEDNIYDKLNPAKEEEEDLLDLAFGLTPTSRLGCQIPVDQIFEGATVYIPSATRNMYVDGSKPAKH